MAYPHTLFAHHPFIRFGPRDPGESLSVLPQTFRFFGLKEQLRHLVRRISSH